MNDLIFWYVVVAIVIMVVSFWFCMDAWDQKERKRSARVFVTAPVWPLAILFLIGYGFYYMSKVAFGDE